MMMIEKPLPVADDEVVFQFGNIFSIAIDEDDPHSITVEMINSYPYLFSDLGATNFLRNFPREYFEGSPDLLSLYDAFWLNEKLPY